MAFDKPLYDAARSGKLDECNALIMKKADVNWRNAHNVLHYSLNLPL